MSQCINKTMVHPFFITVLVHFHSPGGLLWYCREYHKPLPLVVLDFNVFILAMLFGLGWACQGIYKINKNYNGK